ncbi:nucleotidyl transferase AbiEii/AbiGii toxin family protein [Desulfovibrio piger]|uniref:nucleotidyl transferase AbiEii/AbiGii toxin family protein n=1 Tax=Desulfovibrio piger TaxID=901 RepID=UPI00266604F6|nr:nucleotidyl transferase AbiEii/AbiGii toxin family protein [Desulfovibrio piger]
MNSDSWKNLFSAAMQQIKQANLPSSMWTFGGGTVLMHKFSHRFSKDIDIFFSDRQLLGYISPRINDALEDRAIKYIEQDNFIKIYLKEGEIDFILSPRISNCKPVQAIIEGEKIFLDHPVEIIAKKIEHRANEFKARDVFDLAIVYSQMKTTMLKNLDISKEKLICLNRRVCDLHESNILENQLQEISRLPAGEKIRGTEFELFKNFMCAMEKQIDSKQKTIFFER